MDTSRLTVWAKLGGAGRAPYRPDMLLALLIWAYAGGVTSSRQIERRCREDVSFMVISRQARPDHVTIARSARRQRGVRDVLRRGADPVWPGHPPPPLQQPPKRPRPIETSSGHLAPVVNAANAGQPSAVAGSWVRLSAANFWLTAMRTWNSSACRSSLKDRCTSRGVLSSVLGWRLSTLHEDWIWI